MEKELIYRLSDIGAGRYMSMPVQRLAASMESSLDPRDNAAMGIQCSTPCGINESLTCEQ
jgi:hypothetical protein